MSSRPRSTDAADNPSSGGRIGVRMIPLDNLLPHPLNSNVMTDEMREKLRAHIKRTGRYAYTFTFTDNHSTGIYTFDRLRSELSEENTSSDSFSV